MTTCKKIVLLFSIALLALPVMAGAVVEKKSGVEYPDEITVGKDEMSVKMVATGVGLREKTFLKVDVYTIVSYMQENSDLGKEAGLGLVALNAPKRLQLDLRRGFSRDKLVNAFVEGIEANYDDLAPLQADIETFSAYFTRDAEEGDKIIFHFCPAVGLTTELNGEEIGVIKNNEFAQALWTVWFGKKPANGGLKKALLAQIGS